MGDQRRIERRHPDWYRLAVAHADRSIDAFELGSPGVVLHSTDEQTTLGSMLVLMIAETSQHAGHADIIRELIDGTTGQLNAAALGASVEPVQAVADRFR